MSNSLNAYERRNVVRHLLASEQGEAACNLLLYRSSVGKLRFFEELDRAGERAIFLDDLDATLARIVKESKLGLEFRLGLLRSTTKSVVARYPPSVVRIRLSLPANQGGWTREDALRFIDSLDDPF